VGAKLKNPNDEADIGRGHHLQHDGSVIKTDLHPNQRGLIFGA